MAVQFRYGTEMLNDTRGDPYVNFYYDGSRGGGKREPPHAHISSTDAWNAYFAALNALISGLPDTTIIEWRVPPRLDQENSGYLVFSRMSIIEPAAPRNAAIEPS